MHLSFQAPHTGSSSYERLVTISLDPAVAESSSCCHESLHRTPHSMYPPVTTEQLNKQHHYFLIEMQVTQ